MREVIGQMMAEGLIDPEPLLRHDQLQRRQREGEICGVTTTSGLAWKIPGRVGDSPILGAGLYVDGASARPDPRAAARPTSTTCASFLIVEEMRRGKSRRTPAWKRCAASRPTRREAAAQRPRRAELQHQLLHRQPTGRGSRRGRLQTTKETTTPPAMRRGPRPGPGARPPPRPGITTGSTCSDAAGGRGGPPAEAVTGVGGFQRKGGGGEGAGGGESGSGQLGRGGETGEAGFEQSPSPVGAGEGGAGAGTVNVMLCLASCR